jgi:hypothetical protein
MIALDGATVFALLLASALAGALLGIAPVWRRTLGGGGDLPIRRMLAARGEAATLEAELRCALCSGRRTCLKRRAPLPDCPNATLFRPGASGTTAAPPA